MTIREATEVYVATVAIVTVLFDIAVVYLSGGRVSISVVMRDVGHRYPAVVLAAGLIVSHWWWPTK